MHKMSRRTFLKLCTSALLALGLGRFVLADDAGGYARQWPVEPAQVVGRHRVADRDVGGCDQHRYGRGRLDLCDGRNDRQGQGAATAGMRDAAPGPDSLHLPAFGA